MLDRIQKGLPRVVYQRNVNVNIERTEEENCKTTQFIPIHPGKQTLERPRPEGNRRCTCQGGAPNGVVLKQERKEGGVICQKGANRAAYILEVEILDAVIAAITNVIVNAP